MPTVRILDSLVQVPAADWDALDDSGNPFVRHAFLEGLERHGCLRADWGWTPRHLTLWEDGRLFAAVLVVAGLAQRLLQLDGRVYQLNCKIQGIRP